MRVTILLFLLLPALGALAQSDDPAVTVRSFVEAWGRGDAEAAAKSWSSAKSGDFDRFVRRPLASSSITLEGVEVGTAIVNGDVAEVPVVLRYTRQSKMQGAPLQHESARALLQLRRDGTSWRIDHWREAEERFVDELLALPSPAERAAYLDANKAQWSRALVRVLAVRAVHLIFLSQHPLARETSEYATRVAEAMGDDASKSYALGGATAIERSQPRPDIAKSLALANEAVAAAERSGDPNVLALALVRLGRAGPNVAEPAVHERVIAIGPYVDDQAVLAQATSQLGAWHQVSGDYRQALADAEAARRYADEAESKPGMLAAELAFANLYKGVGDSELAALHYEQAAKVARSIGYDRNYASFLHDLLVAQLGAGKPPETLLQTVEEALRLPPAVLTRNTLVDLYRARARMYMALGDYESAEADLGEAIATDIEGRKPYQTLSELRMLQRRYQSAKTSVELGPGIWLVSDWNNYIEAMRHLGELEEAITVAYCAIEHYEFVATAGDDRHRQTFLARRYSIEQNLVEMLVENGDREEALSIAEAAKARVLRDVASRTRADVERPPAELAAERQAMSKVESLNRAIFAERDDAKLASMRAELARTRLELEDLRARAAASVRGNELYAGAWRLPLVRWPHRDATAVLYSVGKDRTLIFTVRNVDGQTEVDVKTVTIDRDELERLVEELRDRVSKRDLRYSAPARRLYDVLIAPVEQTAVAAKTLCIIPDGELWKVPFHALTAKDGKHLLERTAIFYAPSIEMLRAVHTPRSATAGARLLALGNPTVGNGTVARFRALDRALPLGSLAEAETEVRDIARLYGRDRSRVYLRRDAREAVFKEQADEFDVLHVAAHGVVDNASPRYSALVLAAANDEEEDGLLEAHEVAEMRLNAELVVLSACETATGRIGGGEGILGLSWAFLAAGAHGLVGSQWKAPSAATEELMVAFHERLVAGDTPAEALRRAQRKLMADERYASPLDWAPFIIVGDGL